MSNNQYQSGLFRNQNVVLDLDGVQLEYVPDFFEDSQATQLYQALLDETQWRQDTVVVYGKPHLTPRLSCWVGEPWMSYRYSNHTMQPQPWSARLLEIKHQVEQAAGDSFNSVLLNYYRDGQDSNGWHSDNETELGADPSIASLSLGAARDFQLRRVADKKLAHSLSLANGSLLLMRPGVQRRWQHQIPKRANAEGRINLTFRTIIQASSL